MESDKEPQFVFDLLVDNKICCEFDDGETFTFSQSFKDILNSNTQKFGIGKAIEETIRDFSTNLQNNTRYGEILLIRHFIRSELKKTRPELAKEMEEFYSKLPKKSGFKDCNQLIKHLMTVKN